MFYSQMDHIVNPFKTGVRNVAHTVRSVPANLVDGVNMVSDKMSDSINKVFTNKVRMGDFWDAGDSRLTSPFRTVNVILSKCTIFIYLFVSFHRIWLYPGQTNLIYFFSN